MGAKVRNITSQPKPVKIVCHQDNKKQAESVNIALYTE